MSEKIHLLQDLLEQAEDAEAQYLATELLASLVEDEQYEEQLGRYLRDSSQPVVIGHALLRDLRERPESVVRPMADVITRSGTHPLHEHAIRLAESLSGDGR